MKFMGYILGIAAQALGGWMLCDSYGWWAGYGWVIAISVMVNLLGES